MKFHLIYGTMDQVIRLVKSNLNKEFGKVINLFESMRKKYTWYITYW